MDRNKKYLFRGAIGLYIVRLVYYKYVRRRTRKTVDLDEPLRGIHFDATGGLMMYSHGIAQYIEDHFDLSELEFYGVSGGCQPSLFLSSKLGMKTALNKWFLPMIKDINDDGYVKYFWFPAPTAFRRSKRHLGPLMKEDQMRNIQKRCWMQYTTLAFRSRHVNEYADFDDLYNTIVATQYIPFFSIVPFIWHRSHKLWCFDGYLSKPQMPEGRWLKLHPFKWGRYRQFEGILAIRHFCDEEKQLEIRRQGYNDAADHHAYFIEQGLQPLLKNRKIMYQIDENYAH